MTKKEINEYIVKFISPSFSSYYVEKYLMYQSFEDGLFIKGFLFFSKEDAKLGLNISYFILPLFVKTDSVDMTFGGDVFRIERKGLFKTKKSAWWDTTKGKKEETFKAVKDCLLEQGEFILGKYNSANDFIIQNKKDRENIRIQEAVAYSTVLVSSISTQDKELKKLIKIAKNDGRDTDWVNQIQKDAELLLSKTNSNERLKILKLWANETIKELKLSELNLFEQ
jgi:hypothetical protein